MRASDRNLGMGRAISRRDVVQGAGLAALALTLGPPSRADLSTPTGLAPYPPTKTGLRGSHAGSFEVAHALRDGAEFAAPARLKEAYDLIIVGAGISGLAAAHFYQARFGKDSRILILENHDDFGGHARRNEFHQGGPLRLSLGGTHNLEYWQFSKVVKQMMKDLGIDIEALLRGREFDYGFSARNGPAMWFDKETYGTDKLVTNYTLEWWRPGDSIECINELPISTDARSQLQNLYQARTNIFDGKSRDEVDALLAKTSYPDFLHTYAGLGREAIQIFDTSQHGAWGVELRALSAAEAFYYSGLPGLNLVGRADEMESRDYPAAMFPDGNASVARLLAARLIPGLASDVTADNVAVASFDYAALDQAQNSVRLRLNATALRSYQTSAGVDVAYFGANGLQRVSARHCVLAGYHSMIPYLCPDLPGAQKEALRYQVKIPLVLTNVLLRSSDAMDRLGINSVRCPGRMHRSLFMFKGINTGGYAHPMSDSGPVPLVFWGSLSPPEEARTLKDQLRASREKMLHLDFEDYEREVRLVLSGLLGPVGFDVKKDILAITVNRWPHGYSYEYMDLWDEDFAEGQAPHEIARKPFGAICIANADAGASAYTHTAIDEAYRAVGELPGR